MLVCVCKGLSERQVLGTIQSGARTVEEIGRRCGAGTDCGTCVGALEAMIDEHALVRGSRRQRDGVEAQCASPERDAA